MNRLLSASAGSGKTHQLTTHYLRLLHTRHLEIVSGTETSLRVESLLAATFTNKAAGEIFERILSRLADAAGDDEKCAALGRDIEEPSLNAQTCRHILLHLCRHLHRVQVGTLDSFFQRLCRVYGQEAGLSGDLRLSAPDSPRCLALQKEAVHAMLSERSDADETDALFQTLTRQKASSSVVPRLLSLLGGISEAVVGAEPHHWETLPVPERPADTEIIAALSVLEAYREALTDKRWLKAVAGDLASFSGRDWEKFLSSGLAKPCFEGACTYYKTAIPETQVAAYAILVAVARHELLAELKAKTLAIRDLHTHFAAKFLEGRKSEGLTLFSETPALLAKVLGNPADIARRLDAPLEHLLLDEFQDTSDAQWGLLQGFAQGAAVSPGSVFVVGDAKQAIYGWRGGRAEIFELLAFDINEMQRETLEKSYRSSSIVLDAVNAVFQGIAGSEALAKHTQTAERWAEHFQPHEAVKTLPGYVELCVSPVPPDPDAETDEDAEDGDGENWAAGASPHLVQCARRIAVEVSRLPPGTSVGVLVRTNRILAQMTDLLRARGVSVSSEGVGKIADDPAIELIFSALLLADHPGHSAAAYHVATSPLADAVGLPEAECQNPALCASAAATIRRRLLFEGYAGVLARWAVMLAPFGTERTARRLEQLLDIAAELDVQAPLRPSEFVRAVRETSAEHPGSAAVRVMTINRAKGLEFDAVFLPDLDWKLRTSDTPCVVKRAGAQAISRGASPVEAVHARPNTLLQQLDPALRALAEGAEAEEVTGMLCLLYVAMTRPRHGLYLYVAPHKLKKDLTPEKPGIKPAALLRAAFCGSITHPAQSSVWTILRQCGDADWLPETLPPAPIPVPAARPEPRFRQGDGCRRSVLPQAAGRQDTPKRAADLLRLE